MYVINERFADDIGKLVLRLTLGILMLLHGIAKLSGGVGGIYGLVQSTGLPGFLAYGVYLGEVLGPLMLIAGFYARIGAVLIFINMVFAILLVHSHEIFALSGTGGWAIELQGFFLLTAVVVFFIGSGRYAINNG